MINYESFKEKFVKSVIEYFSERNIRCEYILHPVHKTNITYDALTMKKVGMCTGLNIDIHEMYDLYVISGDIKQVVTDVAEKLIRNMNKELHLDYSLKSENITFSLINTNMNKELLEDVPHREFNDLSIVYKHIFKMDEEGIASSIIKKELMESMGKSEEQLYELAMGNTRRLFPPAIKSMDDILWGLDNNILLDPMFHPKNGGSNMYVLSNTRGISGAAVILYKDLLKNFTDQLKSNIYLIPSSVHEYLAVLDNGMKASDLEEMVREVNDTQVSPEERLSDNVYYFDRSTGEVTLAKKDLAKCV